MCIRDSDYREPRADIITTVTLGSEQGMLAFCRGIQSGSPIDSFVTPEGWDMPGYDDPVVMAAGAFVSGSSIELSADGPIKPPYSVYMPVSYTHLGPGGILRGEKEPDCPRG